jgi:Ca2+-transporting ATPase
MNERGLTQAEAHERLQAEGLNELPSARRRDIPAIVLEVMREPMFLLLVCAGAIYLLLGDAGDALMLLGFVFVVMGITIFQEYKTERVLEALRDLSSPRARVVRDGVERRIAGREVARGDILLLSEGDRVAADAVLISCNDFAADESLLTGESVPVRKVANDLFQARFESETRGQQASDEDSATSTARSERGSQDSIAFESGLKPGGEGRPFVYSGTLVVGGRGMARVLATGPRTEMGKIGRALQEEATEITPLQKEIATLVRRIAIAGVLLSLLLVAIHGLTQGEWLHGLLSGITLAMSILPEEYPVILVVFLAMGAWRISRHRVLTRRVPTVEALGAATVLCVDKTGTLTRNRMAAQGLVANGAAFEITDDAAMLPEAFHELVEFAILSSEVEPFDPMEKALHDLGARYLADTEHLHRDWELAHEYSLSPELLALSHVWRARNREEYVVAAKGSPEAVADLCHLDAAQLAEVEAQVNALAAQGMRVLGVARATYAGREWPDIQHDFEFRFLGLVGLADPLRPGVAAALEECATAGIRVVMITGDYPATARAIAREAGLDPGSGGIITGPELERMDEPTLRERVQSCNIFARTAPGQKLRLVNALKSNGEVVAMTGDGVNDAPALKAAHIGIAMGERGTDVAREAAALVLLEDDFASIVRAVRIGRGIFDNLRKAMAYIFAVHLPIAGLALIPLLLGWPPVFEPVHIVFLEMIINPACSIAFEAEPLEGEVMQRPPRDRSQPLFGMRIFLFSLLQGACVLAAALAVLGVALHNGAGDGQARAMAFLTLVSGNLGLILVNRSWRHAIRYWLSVRNPALWWVIGGAAAFLACALTVPFLQGLFHFMPITIGQAAACVGAGLGSALWFELLKPVRGE